VLIYGLKFSVKFRVKFKAPSSLLHGVHTSKSLLGLNVVLI